jgi:hypothetical protein
MLEGTGAMVVTRNRFLDCLKVLDAVADAWPGFEFDLPAVGLHTQ